MDYNVNKFILIYLFSKVLESVAKPVEGVRGPLPGLLFNKLSIEEASALGRVPKQNSATDSHVQVRILVHIISITL